MKILTQALILTAISNCLLIGGCSAKKKYFDDYSKAQCTKKAANNKHTWNAYKTKETCEKKGAWTGSQCLVGTCTIVKT